MKNKILILQFFSIILVSAVLINFLYPLFHPLAGINQTISSEDLNAGAERIAERYQFLDNDYVVDSELRVNERLQKEIENKHGIDSSISYFSDKYPVYYWRFNFSRDDEDFQGIFNNLSLNFDLKGRLLQLNTSVDDSLDLPFLTEIEAKLVARKFVEDNTDFTIREIIPAEYGLTDTLLNFTMDSKNNFKIEKEERIERTTRTDYQFSFRSEESESGKDIKMNISVKGNIISDFRIEYQEDDDTPGTQGEIVRILAVVCYIILFVLIVVIGIKRLRAYEIGFRSAIILSVLMSLSILVEMVIESGISMNPEALIGYFIGPLFIGFIFFVVWAVSETVGREAWSPKYLTIDLLLKGHFLNSRIGKSILIGTGAGFILYIFWILLTSTADRFFEMNSAFITHGENFYGTFVPGAYILIRGFFLYTFTATLVIGFSASLLSRWISSKSLIMLGTGLLWSLMAKNFIDPYYIAVPINFVFGIILTYLFIRYDFLTFTVSLYVTYTLHYGIPLFTNGIEGSLLSGYLLSVYVALTLIYAVYTILTKDEEIDPESIVPIFAKNITERQRMQGELEIARSVQMSFLPKEQPDFANLDIASECIPALEVGGDYYDFVNIDKNKLGIAIGDVAGKGTKAAFYMTLTKGFLKAVSKQFDSPAEVLSQMNNMFYENVDRGNFISMVYGIFNAEDKTFSFSRAGHNPIIKINSENGDYQFFRPDGIALGLEAGEIFSNSIIEEKVGYSKGDIFIFYTDGFTEAVNKKNEALGEEKFLQMILEHSAKPSNEIMSRIIKGTKHFIGSAKQHDDMTIMIVKID